MINTCFLILNLVAPADTKPARVDPSVEFFASQAIPKIVIEIEPRELQMLRMADRSYVPCTVHIEGVGTYKKVGIHLKGAAGSFRPLDQNPALTLNFDKFKDGQKFFGMDKIHLNNSVQDGTYLHEILCRDIFRSAGIPAGRATHALVKLNNRDLGLYLLVEGLDKDFLKRNFKDATGNLYDGGFCADIDGAKKFISGKKGQKDDQAPLKTLTAALREPDVNKRLAAAEKLIDLDQFWTFAALELLTCHWDGYVRNRNNYRIYFDPSRDNRAVFLPWGMDQMFNDPNFDIFGMGCLVSNQLMQCQGMKWRYQDTLRKVYFQHFRPYDANKRIDEITAKLKPVRDIKGGGEDMKRRIATRKETVEKMLREMPQAPPKFGPDNTILLTDWKPALESGPSLHLQSTLDQRTCLHLKTSADSVASWRKPMAMEPGKYRIEALAKAVDVKPRGEGNSGVGVRISGGERHNYISGTTDWKTISMEISIQEPRDVVLVLEMRALSGDVYFDVTTIKIVRLDIKP